MGLARDRGEAGEVFAASYLALAGLQVLERNARVAGVQVDLVARDHNTRVLVEVKFRTRSDYGGAAAALGPEQQDRLRRAATLLAARGETVRIDVVAIQWDADGAVVRHYRNALTG
jgi:putative endonuclease